MIPNTTESVEVVSNITGETGQFTVDENSLAKIMGVLTNLYSDPEMAVVREYLTNALDAQIEAQEADPTYVWRPIEVTTPSHFQKSYIVRDFGIGMSVDDIKETYSKYGKSTKEQSNSVTGMLGLGSKCALTYTNQFTITGFKNGVRTKAVVSKDDNDIPVFMIVDTRATDEPNGVEITVPVRDRNTFAEKTRNFLKWWKDGHVLIDGAEPAKHGLKEVKPNVYLLERVTNGWRQEAPTSLVIMGNVPYEVDPEYVDTGLREAQLGFVAYVPMGAVDFPPSREKLFYNNRTKTAIVKISEGLFDAILTEKLKEVTDAPDYQIAWERWTGLPHYFSSHAKAKGLQYRGQDFNQRIAHAHMSLDWDWQGHGQIAERHYVDINSAMRGALVVTGVMQGTKPTSYFKKKVKHYMETENIHHSFALLVDTDIDTKWLDWLPRIDADTIKNIKLPKNPSANTGPKGEAPYEFYTLDASGNVVFDSQVTIPVPAGKTLVYISPQDMKTTYRKSGCEPGDLLRRLGENYILVVMGKNRYDKFKRAYPNVIPASKAIQNRIDDLVNTTSNAEYLVGMLEYGESEFLKAVDITKVSDPELVALAKMVQDKTFTPNYKKAEDLHSFARRASVVATLPQKKSLPKNVAKRYPLISHMGKREMKHLLIYVNAVYSAEYAPKP